MQVSPGKQARNTLATCHLPNEFVYSGGSLCITESYKLTQEGPLLGFQQSAHLCQSVLVYNSSVISESIKRMSCSFSSSVEPLCGRFTQSQSKRNWIHIETS